MFRLLDTKIDVAQVFRGGRSNINIKGKRSIANKTKVPLVRWIFWVSLATTSFALMFYVSSLQPVPPTIMMTAYHSSHPLLLSTLNHTKITTDVRGNLGPPEVMLRGGTDWLKDRWQAASDMHGTAIKGPHQVMLSFNFPLELDHIVLDWEAAYSKDYILEAAMNNLVWYTLHDSRNNGDAPLAHERDGHFVLLSDEKVGQSPGVKSKTPLHVVHTIARNNHTAAPEEGAVHVALPPKLQYLRLTIRSSAMGWGVSLWSVQVYGWPLVTVTESN